MTHNNEFLGVFLNFGAGSQVNWKAAQAWTSSPSAAIPYPIFLSLPLILARTITNVYIGERETAEREGERERDLGGTTLLA